MELWSRRIIFELNLMISYRFIFSGVVNYIKQMTYIRFYCHFMYAYVKLDVLKMTMHPQDSSIQVRWRISGISGYRILYKMLQFRVWRPKEMIEQHQLP